MNECALQVEEELRRIPRELSHGVEQHLWSIVYMPQASGADVVLGRAVQKKKLRMHSTPPCSRDVNAPAALLHVRWPIPWRVPHPTATLVHKHPSPGQSPGLRPILRPLPAPTPCGHYTVVPTPHSRYPSCETVVSNPRRWASSCGKPCGAGGRPAVRPGARPRASPGG